MGTRVGLGADSFLLIGKETTYNTAPSACIAKIELMPGHSISPKLAVLEDPSMTNTQLSRRFIGQGGKYIEFSLKLRVNFEGWAEVWRMLLANATRTAVGGDSAVFDFLYKEAALNSYTLDLSPGNIPVGKVNRLTGCFITGWNLTGQAANGDAGMLQLELTGLAALLTTNTTPMTGGTFPNPYGITFPLLSRTGTNLKDGSTNTITDIRLRSFGLNVTIPHNPNRLYMGSANADYPVRNGPLDATLTLEEEWNDTTLLDAMLANTATALRLFWQHPTTIGTSSKRELEIQANEPTAADVSLSTPGWDMIIVNASYRLAYDATDASFMTLRARNQDAALAP